MNIKDNKGSITVFVLVGLIFMISFLLISFANNVNKSKIAKEQFNMISSTYSYNDGDEKAYSRAYTDFINKNKKIVISQITYSPDIKLNRTFEEKIVNYKIYGNNPYVGIYMNDLQKYLIQVKVIKSNNESQIYDIYLNYPLVTSNEYIDYKKQCVMKGDEIKEKVTLPTIFTYEGNTTLEILANVIPSKIEVDYVGYDEF